MILLIEYTLNQVVHAFDPPHYLEACYLFGSYISGQYGKGSDIDHLIIVEDSYGQRRDYVKKSLSKILGVPSDWLAVFTKSRFKAMCQQGDYFFWTIKLNCRKVYTKSSFCENIFKRMPVFTHIKRTLDDDKAYFDKSVAEYKKGNLSEELVFKALKHCIRNTCILLLYMHGKIDFGKYTSVRKCHNLRDIHLPFHFEDYLSLQKKKQKLTPKLLKSWSKRYYDLYKLACQKEKHIRKGKFVSPLKKYK